MVKQTKGVTLDMDQLPLDDKKTYDLLNRAETLGVFQLESGGMRDLCRKFQIASVEHITALVALYRPGPMDLIPEFIKRRHGEVKVEYEHPLLEPIAKETYGILIYQEQVMQAAQVLGGYTLGGADLLRRAMGKKKVEEMQQHREIFVKGCLEKNKIPKAKANQVRRLRLQQIPRRRVRRRRLPNRVSQGELSGRVPVRHDDQRHERHGEVKRIHRRGAHHGHRGVSPGCERKPVVLCAGPRDRRMRRLWTESRDAVCAD
jgi:hypothetical protein